MTTRPLRYLELFAGGGGLSHGLEQAGWACVAHAEIEPHARAVLRRHWPDTPLHGDVTQVDWTRYAGQVDLVAGGSPCQDLSVAGKRAGLAGARSGLFYELIRAWNETGATYCLWENVDGARSSNNGADFAAVLSAFVGATISVPADRWESGGVAAGTTGVAAWRVLDLQHFGPPQRRRRVFVVAARTGGGDPAEVLALTESVCGHPSPREQSRQGTARGAAGGVAFSVNNNSRAECVTEGVAPLRSGQRQQQSILAFGTTQITSPANYSHPKPGDPCHPLAAGAHPPTVLAFHHTQTPITDDVAPAFGGSSAGMGVMAFGNSGMESWKERAVAITLAARNAKSPNSNAIGHSGPRRLTPRECERLMGWPDDWTGKGIREDGTTYALSDTARYRICGNGVGSPVAAWIGRQLMLEAA